MSDHRTGRNAGFSLLELIIAISIIAILVGVLAPQYIKYVNKSKKAADMNTAAKLGDIINRAMVDNPGAYDVFDKYNNSGTKRRVTATVNGADESYDVYLVMVNESKYKYWFYGTMSELMWKSDDNIGLYNYINQELGFQGVMKGTSASWSAVRENDSINPQYKPDPPASLGTGAKIDRWRIVKRVDTGTFEIWSAADFRDGRSGGGKPCYRVWPNPDDVYAK